MNAVLPSSCRAALLVEPGKPMEIADVRVPDVLERGALLVRTTAATVCATDVHLWAGTVPGNANTLANTTDISGEVTRRFLPGLQAGVSTPRSR
jgi:D-arabinose 1-dehydrogenase-like Zn-dependent alcohol dehydrogenase